MLAEVFLAVKDHPLLNGLEHLIGREHIGERSAPPRIVWVPTVCRYAPSPVKTGNGPNTPRAILGGWQEVRIQLWAKAQGSEESVDEVRAVEELARRVLVAIHDTAFGVYRADALEWNSEGAEQAQLGRMAELVVAFQIPVTREPPALATITAAPASDMTGTAALVTDVTASPVP